MNNLHIFRDAIPEKNPCSFVLMTDLDADIGHTDVIKWDDAEPRHSQLERFLNHKALALCIDSCNVEIDGNLAATTEY